MPVWDQLSPRWAEMCRAAHGATFAWAHNGINKNGWVEFKENGVLLTQWCEGSWKVLANDPDVVNMTFGSSQHLCRVKEGGFLVEEKFLTRTGKASYKPGSVKSCGWIKSASDTGGMIVRPLRRGRQREKQPEAESDEEASRPTSFQQTDLRFDAFFSEWSWKRKVRTKLASERPL